MAQNHGSDPRPAGSKPAVLPLHQFCRKGRDFHPRCLLQSNGRATTTALGLEKGGYTMTVPENTP